MSSHKLHDDPQLMSTCVYCGRAPETSDHVPSTMLLDEPSPEDIPEVPACWDCTTSLSQHAEYLACLIDGVLAGTTEIDKLGREKVRQALRRSQSLQASIEDARVINDAGAVYWRPDNGRVRTVILMLARGHAAYMLSEPQYHDPDVLEIVPLERMTDAAKREFENLPEVSIWPERGSRAFEVAWKAMAASLQQSGHQPPGWDDVQPGRYRYAVSYSHRIEVRIVLSEYLACLVAW